MTLIIESNVSIPVNSGRGPRPLDIPELDSMKEGESVFFKSDAKRLSGCSEAMQVANYMRKRGKKITTRRVEGGFRIWLVDGSDHE